jgi:hypothetical protein
MAKIKPLNISSKRRDQWKRATLNRYKGDLSAAVKHIQNKKIGGRSLADTGVPPPRKATVKKFQGGRPKDPAPPQNFKSKYGKQTSAPKRKKYKGDKPLPRS